jgi:hypothetical protein
LDDKIKENEIGGANGVNGAQVKYIQGFGGET